MIPNKGDIIFLNKSLIKEFEKFGIATSDKFKKYVYNCFKIEKVVLASMHYFIYWETYDLCIKHDGTIDYEEYGRDSVGQVQAFVKENKEIDPDKHCTCGGEGELRPMFTSTVMICKLCDKEKLNC